MRQLFTIEMSTMPSDDLAIVETTTTPATPQDVFIDTRCTVTFSESDSSDEEDDKFSECDRWFDILRDAIVARDLSEVIRIFNTFPVGVSRETTRFFMELAVDVAVMWSRDISRDDWETSQDILDFIMDNWYDTAVC